MQIKHIILSLFVLAILFAYETVNCSQINFAHSRDLDLHNLVNLKSQELKIDEDSVSSNSITKVWYSSSELNVEIFQVYKQQEITITVYNMLGKEVLEVFRGISSTQQVEEYSTAFNLPNGIYICILQGKNFRDSEKFIISR